MATREELIAKLKQRKLDIKKEKLKRLIEFKKGQPRTAEQNASDILSGTTAEKVDTSNVGALGAAAVGFKEGIYDVGRGLGIADQQSRQERRFSEQLEKDRPISSTIGNISGQVAPFLIPSTAVGSISSLPARVAASTGLGALEGGILSRGQGANIEDAAKGAIAGGAIAGGLELLFPSLGRVGRAAFRKLRGQPDKLVGANGLPTLEFQKALDDAGIGFDDVKEAASQFSARTNPEQAARLADFQSAGVPATKGDINNQFGQQAEEARLFSSTAEKLADEVRGFRLNQSKKFEEALKTVMPSNAQGESIGESVKTALAADKKILMRNKNAYYKKAAQAAESFGGIPILPDDIASAIPSNRIISRLSRLDAKTDAYKDLLTEFGIANFEDSAERLAKQGVEPINLTLDNAEDFRAALNSLSRSDKTGQTSVLTQPIIDALDGELDNLAGNALSSGKQLPKEVVSNLKKARATVTEIKKKFSPESITGRLVNLKRDGETPVIEASKVFKEIVGTNKPPELLARVVKRLSIGGKKGQQAMQDLQAATVLDLVESAYKGRTRKVAGEQIFSPVAFNNRLDQIGDKRLALIFGENTPAYRKVKQMGRLAANITPPNEAVPKGSAPVLADLMRKIGLVSLSSKIPGIDIAMEGLTSLSESRATRRSVEAALNSSPELMKQSRVLEELAPSFSAALLISTQAQAQEEKQ